MMIQMSILIHFKVISHSWPERESPILWQQTTTLSLITKSLDRLQMITVQKSIEGRRIELQFILIRLIMWCVCVFYTYTLLHDVQMKERKQKAEKEAVNLVEHWETSRMRWNIISCAFCPPLTQEVLLNLPATWCVFKSKHTNKMKTSHTISTPTMISTFLLFILTYWEVEHWKPMNLHTNHSACLSRYI